MDMSLTETLNAVQDLSDVLNGLTDVALSGTPRICGCQTYFFKVFPTYAGSAAAPFDPLSWKSYDNADLSGSPKLLAFAHNGNVYLIKGYPSAEETANPTTDIVQNLMTKFRDDIVSGDPTIFRILSGANYYYFKAYRETDFIEPAVPITPATPSVIATPLSEARTALRALLQDPAAILYPDTEIDSWLNMAAVDVSGKTLCCRENNMFYVPVNDLSGSLNRIIDVVLSGTPRVCETKNLQGLSNQRGRDSTSSGPCCVENFRRYGPSWYAETAWLCIRGRPLLDQRLPVGVGNIEPDRRLHPKPGVFRTGRCGERCPGCI
jgi:hypothetical protein